MQAVVRLQIQRGVRFASATQIGLGGHQDRLGGAQGPCHMGIGRVRGVANCQVKTFCGQGAQAIRQVQLNAHIGVVFQKFSQQGHQLLPGQGHRRGDSDQATGLLRQIAHLGKAVLDLLERGAGLVHQFLACLGQAQAAGGALHQRDFGGPLQLRNALAHRRLADAQALRRRGEAAQGAQHAEPVSLIEGKLLVQCSSTAWATQLTLTQSDILSTIRASAPGALVEAIRFIGPQAPSWKKGLRSVSNGRGPRDTYG